MVGCDYCPVVFIAAARHKRLRYSKLPGRSDPSCLSHLLPSPLLHAYGSCLVEKGPHGHTIVAVDGVFLWRNGIRGNIKSVSMDATGHAHNGSDSWRHSDRQTRRCPGNTIRSAIFEFVAGRWLDCPVLHSCTHFASVYFTGPFGSSEARHRSHLSALRESFCRAFRDPA